MLRFENRVAIVSRSSKILFFQYSLFNIMQSIFNSIFARLFVFNAFAHFWNFISGNRVVAVRFFNNESTASRANRIFLHPRHPEFPDGEKVSLRHIFPTRPMIASVLLNAFRARARCYANCSFEVHMGMDRCSADSAHQIPDTMRSSYFTLLFSLSTTIDVHMHTCIRTSIVVFRCEFSMIRWFLTVVIYNIWI